MPTFDPNAAAAADAGIFGLPCTEEEAKIICIPATWDATTSYRAGTAKGPEAIFEASMQVDLYDGDVVKPYEAGIFMRPVSPAIKKLNAATRKQAEKIIAVGGDIGGDKLLAKALEKVNEASLTVNEYVYKETAEVLKAGKLPAVIGGEHSVPFGAFKAAAGSAGEFGILHFDAHSDTRKAFEGFEWSHASIMYNATSKIPEVKKLVQVGIRDYCEQEADYCAGQPERIKVFTDRKLSLALFKGATWDKLAHDIVAALPEKVWISFDIDGLDPKLCPNTGTPVPGGLSFAQANHVFSVLAASGRKIIGFDLTEVAPAPSGDNEWDANVGTRLLYKLAAWTLATNALATVTER